MNINEIAKLAGVSRATVSRYLNHGYVSEEKKEKIKKVIEQTGYIPSSQAQMLRTKKTKLIGVIIPKINSDTVSRMVAGISMILSQNDYQLLLANTNNNEMEELKYLDLFKKNQVDGVILIGTIFTKKHRSLIKDYKVPIVILGQRLNGYSCVYHDDYEAAKELTRLLLKKGNQIGFIGVTQRDEAAGKNRRKGFLDAVKTTGKEWKEKEAEFNMESGYEKAKELFQEEPEIDSLFCATDNIAAGAWMYIKEMGKRVPEEIQLIGIGDTPMSKIMEPRLTTVHFYYKSSGIEAAAMLIQMLEAHETMKKEIKMGYEIMVRESIRT